MILDSESTTTNYVLQLLNTIFAGDTVKIRDSIKVQAFDKDGNLKAEETDD